MCVKGFFRRASLIPNRWKLRIGAIHELCTRHVDNNVQIQGLSGRMTGYWRNDIEAGHKTGPYRTSIQAIEEYEKIYHDPFGENSYQSSGFRKKKGKVNKASTMLSPHNIANLVPVKLPIVEQDPDKKYEVFDCQEDAIKYAKENLGKKLEKRKGNLAPKILLDKDGKNPSIEYIFGRMWGIDENIPVRMVPVNDDKWCLYWKPSLIKKR